MSTRTPLTSVLSGTLPIALIIVQTQQLKNLRVSFEIKPQWLRIEGKLRGPPAAAVYTDAEQRHTGLRAQGCANCMLMGKLRSSTYLLSLLHHLQREAMDRSLLPHQHLLFQSADPCKNKITLECSPHLYEGLYQPNSENISSGSQKCTKDRDEHFTMSSL